MDDQKGPNMSPWMRSLAIWVAILAALALFVSIFEGRGSSGNGQTIAYSDFVSRVEQGSVKSVVQSGDTITGTLKSGEEFKTFAVPDPQFAQRMIAANVNLRASLRKARLSCNSCSISRCQSSYSWGLAIW